MGIISGQRSFDKDLRAQANTIVQDRLKENEMINKETARANAQAVDNYNRDVIEEDKEYADNRFLAVQKKNDQKYNTTQKDKSTTGAYSGTSSCKARRSSRNQQDG